MKSSLTWIKRTKTAFQFISNGGLTAAVCNLFLGRCTFAAIILGSIGVYGFLHGKDLTSYSLFMSALLSYLVIHSTKEDYFNDRQQAREQSTKTIVTDNSNPNEVVTTVQNS